jgi:hypothetical protein
METGGTLDPGPASSGPSVPAVDLATVRLVGYVPTQGTQRWIDEEIKDLSCTVHLASSIAATFQTLRETVMRRALIIDIDALSSAELVELRILRKGLTSGVFIALGRVRQQLRASLRITHAITSPFGSEALRFIVSELERRRDTLELTPR